METTRPSDRVASIQAMRGIAALLVVAVHACDLARFRHTELHDALGALSSPGFYSDFGASGVDLFFVISGFVMAMVMMRTAAVDRARFVRNRLLRIVPLYWTVTLVFAAERLLLGRPIAPAALLSTVTFVPLWGAHGLVQPILPVGWTLGFELFFYAALLPALAAPASRRLGIALGTVATLALAGLVLPIGGTALAQLMNPIWFEFALGIGLFWAYRGAAHLPARRSVLLSGLALLALGAAVRIVPDVLPPAILDEGAGVRRACAWGLPWAMVLYGLLGRGESVPMRYLGALGDASYSLYLVHLALFLPIELLLPAGWIAPDLLSLLAAGLAVGAGLACHRYVERPMLTAIRRALSLRRGTERSVAGALG